MALFSGADTIKGVFSGVGTLAKDIRSAITGEMAPEKKAELEKKILEFEQAAMQAQSSIIVAEANGGSWLQRNWRPITMMTFLVLVILNAFNLLVNPIGKEMWTLLQIGLGGYVVGRSAEKSISAGSGIIKSLTKKQQ